MHSNFEPAGWIEFIDSPDWDDLTLDYTLDQRNRLWELEWYRKNHPIMLAMIQGCRTAQSIAVRCGWPLEVTTLFLRKYKKQGIVFDTEGKASVEWYFNINRDTTQLQQLTEFYIHERRKGGLFHPAENGDG